MDKSTKSAEAFRTISEVSDILDVPQHVLRFWEGKFSQIKPMKRGGNRRYYRPEDLELLRAITHLLYTDGYTIKGVQKLLRENGVRATVNAYIAEHGSFHADYDGTSETADADALIPDLVNSDGEAAEADAASERDVAPQEEEPALDLEPQPQAALDGHSADVPQSDRDDALEMTTAADLPDMAALPNAAQVLEELKAIQAILKP